MKNTHDYIHHYRGYWSRGGKCRIRIYQEDGRAPVIVRSQLPDNDNTSVTNMAEHLAAERIEGHGLPVPVIWGEHYRENRGRAEEWWLVSFSSWPAREASLGGGSFRSNTEAVGEIVEGARKRAVRRRSGLRNGPKAESRSLHWNSPTASNTTQPPETFVKLGERWTRAPITMKLGIGRLSEGRGGSPTRQARYGGQRADRYALGCIRADGRERGRDAKQLKGDVENG